MADKGGYLIGQGLIGPSSAEYTLQRSATDLSWIRTLGVESRSRGSEMGLGWVGGLAFSDQ